MFDFRHPDTLRRILWLDTATCVATGLLMGVGANALASITALPPPLLFWAGLSLFPIAAFIALVASRASIPASGVWLVVVGNAAWSLASLALLTDERIAPNGIGVAFIVAQAAAVAALAELEYMALRHMTRRATA